LSAVLAARRPQHPQARDDLRLVRGLAARQRPWLVAGTLLMLLESAAGLAVPWTMGVLAASLLGGDAPPLPPVLAAMLAFFAVQAVARFGSTFALETAGDHMVADLRLRLYDHLQALPMDYYHRRRLGDTLALLTHDVSDVASYVSGTAVAVAPLLLTAGGAVGFMLGIRADLALVALALVPLFYFALKVLARHLRPLSRAIQDEEAASVAMVHENLGLLPAIKAFTREPHESERYRAQVGRVLRLSALQRRLHAALGPVAQFLAAVALVGVFALVGGDVSSGRLAPGELVAFLLYAQLLARPVGGLADVYGATQRMRGALARLSEAMDEPPERDAGALLSLPAGPIGVEFDDVSFRYEGRRCALDGLTLRIAPGEKLAFVGPNGAGKSTVAHLLTRLHDPDRGRIAIGGIDICSVPLAELRGRIGLVPQHVLLFNAPVADNIAYGRLHARPEEIEAAARAAGAHAFIEALPQGYDTVIGDRGVRLSGGQQQRLALARALIKDPPILILDEATAMFDPEAEEDFLRAGAEALRGRTVVFITHRPASLAMVDRIVHMRDGRIERIEQRGERRVRVVTGQDD
jgi:subfamily B ATP-binding cassette protein MsbA